MRLPQCVPSKLPVALAHVRGHSNTWLRLLQRLSSRCVPLFFQMRRMDRGETFLAPVSVCFEVLLSHPLELEH